MNQSCFKLKNSSNYENRKSKSQTKVIGSVYPDPYIRIWKKAEYPENFGSDIGSGYPKISNYPTRVAPRTLGGVYAGLRGFRIVSGRGSGRGKLKKSFGDGGRIATLYPTTLSQTALLETKIV